VREPYLSQILSGRKTVEVRVGYDNIRRLHPGDRLNLNDEHTVTIRRTAHYTDFDELLAHEDPTAIAPDIPPGELLDAIRQIYPPDKEALGAVALEVSSPPSIIGTDTERYEAILFDMGHTLVYFEPSELVVVQQALRSVGAQRTPEEIRAAIQAVWGQYYTDAATATFPATPEYDHQIQLLLSRGLLEHLGQASDAEFVQSYTNAIDSFFSQPGAIRPFPEVIEVLTTLQERGYRLSIVSNWSWNLRNRVTQAGLDGFFELVWGSAYAGCNKPHPGIFQQALARMDLPAGRALYVGDSYDHDVVGARNAGLDVVLLDRKGESGDVDCLVIQDLWGLLDML
jgi:HAD superfamily hydrolase (TIGR01662 family)